MRDLLDFTRAIFDFFFFFGVKSKTETDKEQSYACIKYMDTYLNSGVASVACISVSGNHVQSFH
jgi:hypothetical protein